MFEKDYVANGAYEKASNIYLIQDINIRTNVETLIV